MKKNSTHSRAFTLIELLVVISIIGILSAIIFTNFVQAKAGARDDIRQSDLKALELSINLYKAQNGRYPKSCRGSNHWSGNVKGSYKCTDGTSQYIKGLTPDYIATLPIDPRASSYISTSNKGYLYKTNDKGTAYVLLANDTVEVKKIKNYNDEFARCDKSYGTSRCGSIPLETTYAVYSAGAESW